MTITVRLDAAPGGPSDLGETLRMAVGLALGDATVQVVFTDAGRYIRLIPVSTGAGGATPTWRGWPAV